VTFRAPEHKIQSRHLDYTCVTETPGTRITRDARAMQASRYAFAANMCAGKDVLEVACGSGCGLGLFARAGATKVVGGDCTQDMILHAARYYRDRVKMLGLDAHRLPFKSESFDLIFLFEAIYYLRSPEAFFSEARRVLRPHGQMVICTINREWRYHNPSPLSIHYLSAKELGHSLSDSGFENKLYGGFRVDSKGYAPQLVSSLKRVAINLGLIPKTMKGKEGLKRLFLGPLEYAPRELEAVEQLSEIPICLYNPRDASQFKVIYAVAWKLASEP
jgi:ubiquinone/menaquinone biosynthesis C-methylase UbiE